MSTKYILQIYHNTAEQRNHIIEVLEKHEMRWPCGDVTTCMTSTYEKRPITLQYRVEGKIYFMLHISAYTVDVPKITYNQFCALYNVKPVAKQLKLVINGKEIDLSHVNKEALEDIGRQIKEVIDEC